MYIKEVRVVGRQNRQTDTLPARSRRLAGIKDMGFEKDRTGAKRDMQA